MPTTTYHTVGGRILGHTKDGRNTVYLTDALGSVTGTVEGTEPVLNNYRYEPFGADLSTSELRPSPAFRYAGATGSRRTDLPYSEQYSRSRYFGVNTAAWTTIVRIWPRDGSQSNTVLPFPLPRFGIPVPRIRLPFPPNPLVVLPGRIGRPLIQPPVRPPQPPPPTIMPPPAVVPPPNRDNLPGVGQEDVVLVAMLGALVCGVCCSVKILGGRFPVVGWIGAPAVDKLGNCGGDEVVPLPSIPPVGPEGQFMKQCEKHLPPELCAALWDEGVTSVDSDAFRQMLDLYERVEKLLKPIKGVIGVCNDLQCFVGCSIAYIRKIGPNSPLRGSWRDCGTMPDVDSCKDCCTAKAGSQVARCKDQCNTHYNEF